MAAEIKKATSADPAREKALSDYRKKLVEHREVEAKLKTMREELKTLTKQVNIFSCVAIVFKK
jgi:vacuolar-type H+-ATPase subunit D/Vma8